MNDAPTFFVVSDFPDSHDTLRYAEAARNSGHNAILITHSEREKIKTGDAVVLRGSSKKLDRILETLRHIELVGAVCLTTASGWAASKDRYETYRLLRDGEVQTPYTADSAQEYLKHASVPAVVKLSDSNGGRGVSVADTDRSLLTFTSTLENAGLRFVIQEYIDTQQPEDFRYFVVGSAVRAVMKRTALEGDFRSNLSLGSSAVGVPVDEALATIAVKAAHALNLKLAGVDIMISANGPAVIEVNSSPGLSIESITGIDVAGAVIDEVRKIWEK